MRKLIAVGGTLIVLLTSAAASARSLHPLTYVLFADLTEVMNIDQDSHLDKLNIFGGKVEVRQIRKEINLALQYAPECPVGMMCPAVLVDHNITLPIISEYTGDCGSTVYVAQKDDRPVDGILEKIIVTDYTNNKCPHFIALPETGITYESAFYDRINGAMVNTHSTFEATELEGRMLPTKRLEEILPALK